MRLRRLVIAEVERFPELGRALYDAGPGRAIAGLAATFARWHEQRVLHAPDALIAATHFNWLIMADPVNRAMLLGDAGVPDQAALERHAQEAVRVFLAAYGPT
jgi:TetR/AcrR family transcriptional regulator, mexJK operon transcriptional repressor